MIERRQALFEFAVLFHPTRTKEESEAGRYPKSVLVVAPKTVLAAKQEEVAILAAQAIPAEYTDRLDGIEVRIRPF